MTTPAASLAAHAPRLPRLLSRVAQAAGRREVQAVVTLTFVAALLRFTTLHLQSFWYDEALTGVLVRKPLGEVLPRLDSLDAAPPLYLITAWLWTRPLGTGEVALRSLSALFGTATVPVAYAAARSLVSLRAALVTAALVATSPYLVWYSQDARPYGLLMFLAAVSFLFFVRALQDKSNRALLCWTLASFATCATHYFGAFLVAVEGVILLAAVGGRRTVGAVAALAAPGVAFAALAAAQAANGGPDWVARLPLAPRVKQLAVVFATGQETSAGSTFVRYGLHLPQVLLVAAGLLLLLLAARRGERRGGLIALGVAAAAAAIPLVLALAGLDFFYHRYVIFGWVPFAIAVAAGLSARTAGLLAGAALCALGIAVTAVVASDPSFQRPDWRHVAEVIGPARDSRALVSTPRPPAPLAYYLSAVEPLEDGEPVSEVVLVSEGGAPLPGSLPGFAATRTVETRGFEIKWLRASRPTAVDPDALLRAVDEPRGWVVLQR